VKAAHRAVPVLKPNEAMIEEASAADHEIGLSATFGPTLQSMTPDFASSFPLKPKLAEGALDAHDRGDGAEHDRLATETARDLAACDAIALAQFSLARAAPQIAREYGRPAFTTPHSATRKLRRLLTGDC
jgi:hypothetical protein